MGQNERCGHGIGMKRARAAKLEEPRIEAALQETESIDIRLELENNAVPTFERAPADSCRER
jgi:hypothetical protein